VPLPKDFEISADPWIIGQGELTAMG
jgi:hypothetical protein